MQKKADVEASLEDLKLAHGHQVKLFSVSFWPVRPWLGIRTVACEFVGVEKAESRRLVVVIFLNIHNIMIRVVLVVGIVVVLRRVVCRGGVDGVHAVGDYEEFHRPDPQRAQNDFMVVNI